MEKKERIRKYVEEYGDRVSALAWSLCRNGQDAQDLYQETWMKAMRHLDRYEEDKPFDRWIAAICVNTYKNTFRAFVRSRRAEFSTTEKKERFFAGLTQPSPDRDALITVRQAIESLSADHQILIKLKYFMDYPDEEIAAATGLPVGTVKSRLHKARVLLERRIRDEI